MRAKHIAVLMGGWSAEREVSLAFGKACAGALEGRGYRATRTDVGRDIASVLAALRPDAALSVLHGRPGEDGTLQGILEVRAGFRAGAQKDVAKVMFAAGKHPPDGRVSLCASRLKSGLLLARRRLLFKC